WSAQSLRYDRNSTPANAMRNSITPKPMRLRSSIFGSPAQVRNVTTSWASCSTVALVPSEYVTLLALSGGGIEMFQPSKYGLKYLPSMTLNPAGGLSPKPVRIE